MVYKTSYLKGALLVAFYNECIVVLHDMIWALSLVIILIATDLWWGKRETNLHYKDAKTHKSRSGLKMHEWRWSRAIRRTINKVVDYFSLVVLAAVCGVAITEPLGMLTHMQMASLGAGLAMIIECMSIWGHIVIVKRLTGQRLGVLGTIISKLVRSKSDSLADALDEISNDNKGGEQS